MPLFIPDHGKYVQGFVVCKARIEKISVAKITRIHKGVEWGVEG